MIEILPPYMSFSDDRGSITGIINRGEWREFNLVTSRAGSKRGGHYHRETKELFIILEGRVDVSLIKVSADGFATGEEASYSFKKGDAFIIAPFVCHSFSAAEDAVWINVLSKAHDKDAPDMFAVEGPKENA